MLWLLKIFSLRELKKVLHRPLKSCCFFPKVDSNPLILQSCWPLAQLLGVFGQLHPTTVHYYFPVLDYLQDLFGAQLPQLQRRCIAFQIDCHSEEILSWSGPLLAAAKGWALPLSPLRCYHSGFWQPPLPLSAMISSTCHSPRFLSFSHRYCWVVEAIFVVVTEPEPSFNCCWATRRYCWYLPPQLELELAAASEKTVTHQLSPPLRYHHFLTTFQSWPSCCSKTECSPLSFVILHHTQQTDPSLIRVHFCLCAFACPFLYLGWLSFIKVLNLRHNWEFACWVFCWLPWLFYHCFDCSAAHVAQKGYPKELCKPPFPFCHLQRSLHRLWDLPSTCSSLSIGKNTDTRC